MGDPPIIPLGDYSGRCPLCGSHHVKLQGELTTPPTSWQMQDEQSGTKRDYWSVRMWCANCSNLFDVILRNWVG